MQKKTANILSYVFWMALAVVLVWLSVRSIDWKQFGHDAEALCQQLGLDYYIKESLRAEMEAR